MVPNALAQYGKLCGWTLARAHACSGDGIAIAAYLGNGPSFDRAIVDFCHAYAEQNERDYKALTEAVESGRITAKWALTGVIQTRPPTLLGKGESPLPTVARNPHPTGPSQTGPTAESVADNITS